MNETTHELIMNIIHGASFKFSLDYYENAVTIKIKYIIKNKKERENVQAEDMNYMNQAS